MTDIISQPTSYRTAKYAKSAKKNKLCDLRALCGWFSNENQGVAVLVVWKTHSADQALHAPSVLQAITRQ